MKKILITGAGGFIGSHLAELSLREGYEVRALVRYNSTNHWGWLEDSPLKNDMEIVAGDVREYASVYSALEGCDTVLHLAALIGIPYSYLSPLAYIRTNLEGTYNLLQAAREQGTERIVVTSTSETYGSAQYVPIDEDHPSVGQSPYSASKIAADQYAVSYAYSFDLPVRIIRPFNTFGPRQSARAIIPTVITQILSGRDSIKLGNTTPTRDFTYVVDTARAFLALAQMEGHHGEAINVGNNREISMGDLVHLISKIMDRPIEVITEEQRIRPEKSEVDRLVCNNEKILEKTDWKPQYSLREGLSETVEWFEKNHEKYKAHIYNV